MTRRNPLRPTLRRRGPRHGDVPAAPARLYHATTALTRVLLEGPKPRELVQPSGIGGGTRRAVSLTADPYIACEVARCLFEAVAILRGDVTLHDVLAWARRDGVYEDTVKYFVGSRVERLRDESIDDAFKRYLDGWKLVGPQITDALPPGGRPAAEGWLGGDGRMRYAYYFVPVVVDDWTRCKHAFELYRAYLAFVEGAKVRYNPVFFCVDEQALSQVPYTEIGVVEVALTAQHGLEAEPYGEEARNLRPGAYTYEAGMDEFRVYDWRAIRVVGVVDCSRV